MALIEKLGLEDARLVALCGAGGKTSLLYALGEGWRQRQAKVVLTTTAHIQSAMPPGCIRWDVADEEELLSCWQTGFVPVAARPLVPGKLKGPSEEMWAILRKAADRIVVEADGAACHPVKFPAVWEPVIPQYADRVLVLCGLTALDRPIREVCHRAELALEKGLVPDGPLTEEGLATLLIRGYGRYDPLFVLSQADDDERLARAGKLAALLADQGYGSATLSLQDMAPAQ